MRSPEGRVTELTTPSMTERRPRWRQVLLGRRPRRPSLVGDIDLRDAPPSADPATTPEPQPVSERTWLQAS
jgi:hypothetical protein